MTFFARIAGVMMVAFLFAATPAFAQIPTNSADYFPKLPPSIQCKKDYLLGTWKLLSLYEVPAGEEMELYATRPLQFFVFTDDNRYGAHAGPIRDIAPADVMDAIFKQQTSLNQYVVNEKGIIFFYKDSIAIDSLACFIVAQDSGAFVRGQMLLMPQQKAAKGRMVKIFQKIWVPNAVTPTNTTR